MYDSFNVFKDKNNVQNEIENHYRLKLNSNMKSEVCGLHQIFLMENYSHWEYTLFLFSKYLLRIYNVKVMAYGLGVEVFT